ncbi:MAG: MCE family protein [Gemmatimonadetes bacterium]|nr:MCE family protein [Gemmatimonadota bacterium]
MSQGNIELRVGITVLLSFVVLIGGIIFMSQSMGGSSNLKLDVKFDEVGGLIVGDIVRVSGVKKGKVTDMELLDGAVLVKVEVERGVLLHEDASFAIESFGLMGEMGVGIQPGKVGKLDESKIHPGVYAAGLNQMMAQTAPLLESVQQIVDQLKVLIENEQISKPLEGAVANLNEISTEVDEILGQSRGDLQASLKSARNTSESLERVVTKREGEIDETITTLAATTKRLDGLITKLEGTTTDLQLILADVQAGKGTLGKITKDDELYNELMATINNTNTLIDDFRRNPKRYVSISLF